MFCAWRLIKIRCWCRFKYCSNISPFHREFLHEMLMWIGMDAFDLVAWLLVAGWARWLWGWLGAGIGGAEGAGGDASIDCDGLKHFFQINMPIRKRTKAMTIMAAGEVNVQWASAGLIWSSYLNSSLASNSPLYLVRSPWIALWMPSVLALPNRSANLHAQSMVFLWISMVSDSSAEITWPIVRM